MRKFIATACILGMLGLLAPASSHSESLSELDNRLRECNEALKRLVGKSGGRIPKKLLQKCRAIAIFPGLVKAGALVGVSYGSGVIVKRDPASGKWSKPAFFRIRGASIGVQAGAQFADVVLLIMSDLAIEGLLEDKITLGADLSVSAGPVAGQAAADTDYRFNSRILSYSSAKGLFLGLSFRGASLAPDVEANKTYHGPNVSVQDVFYEGSGSLTPNGRDLIYTLEQATK